MSKLRAALKSDRFVITSELTPPKGIDLGELFAKADALKDIVDALNLTESHAARMAMDPVAVGHLLLDRGIEPIVQMTSRDKNRIAIQASLLGAAALGIPNIVFMGGDPPKNGDHPNAKPVFDLFASQLLEAARSLQSGHDLSGNKLKGVPSFCVGAVVNPGAPDIRTELDNMQRKIDAGAEFFQTQAVYTPAAFEKFMNAAAKSNVSIVAGIIPIKSVKMATYMNDHVPGVSIPDELIAEIAQTQENGRDVAATSVDIAARIIRDIKPMCQGVHIMAIGWEANIPQIVGSAGLREMR